MSAELLSRTLAPVAPPPWWRQWGSLAHVARSRVAMMFAYRNTMLLFLGVSVIQIFMLTRVWSALYAARPDVLAIPLPQLLVYLTVANLISWSFPTHMVTMYLRERIREGAVVFDLVRPLGFVPQMAAHMVGSLGGAMIIITMALPLILVAGSLALPADWAAAGLFVVSLLCGYAIAGMLALLIGMIAFWTLEMDGVTMLYVLVAQFLSGALVPLSAFPDGLRTVVQLLPFQATTYVPTSIYVGSLRGSDALGAIGVQLVWVAVAALAVALLWSRAVRRVVVQGG